MTNIELYKKLRLLKYKITKQQYLTIKGQIKNGDLMGANKGIFKCLLKNSINNKEGKNVWATNKTILRTRL